MSRQQAIAAAQHVALRLRGEPVDRVRVDRAGVTGHRLVVELRGMLSHRGWAMLQAAAAEVDDPEWGSVDVVVEAPESVLALPGRRAAPSTDPDDDGVLGDAAPSAAPAGNVPTWTPEGALYWTRGVFLGRAAAQLLTDPAASAALTLAAGRLVGGRNSGDAVLDKRAAHAVYSQGFDEAVRLAHPANTEKLLDWLTARARDTRGGKPWDESYDPFTERGAVPATYFARRVAAFLVAAYNPDAQASPALRATLLGIAAELVNSPAFMVDGWNPAATGSMYGWLLLQRVPVAASHSRTFIQNSAEIAGFKPATTWDLITSGVKDAGQEVIDAGKALKPPGGWGMLPIAGIVAAAGVAAWNLTRK